MFKLVVLSCLVAAAAAGYLAPLGPLGYSTALGPLGYSTALGSLGYSTPLIAPYGYNAYNYRGPLSLAPGQPANILAADGRPLDTLDVNLDRSAHYTAKALEGSAVHLLKKRSAPLLAPLGRVAVTTPLVQAPLAYSTPLYGGARLAVSPIGYSAAPIAHYW